MTPATLVITGKITDYDERTGVLTIKAPCDDWFTLCKREISKVRVQLIDNRNITDKQRKFCYAVIRAIADWAGDDAASMKDYLKLEFWSSHIDDLGDKIFSLSDAPVSLIAEFQRFLVQFVVSNGVPLKFSLLSSVDDVGDYIYSCLINKRCCICGRPSDLHHVDAVGMGRDRTEIIHEGMEVLPLCRTHHNEYHTAGHQSFMEKYHIDRGVTLDRTLCKIYKLKTERRRKHD